MLSRPLLTTQEVAELVKVREATVRQWIRDGDLPAVHLHREWRVSVRHLEEFVAARLTTGRSSEATLASDLEPIESARIVGGELNLRRRAKTASLASRLKANAEPRER